MDAFTSIREVFAHLSSFNNSNNGDIGTDLMLVHHLMGDGWYCLIEDVDDS
jgi:hypothetical protein